MQIHKKEGVPGRDAGNAGHRWACSRETQAWQRWR